MTASAGEVLASLPAGASIVLAPGCGEPVAVVAALAAGAAPAGATIYSGLLLGQYPFLGAVEAGELNYVTWHPMQQVSDLIDRHVVDFVPIRASQVPDYLREIRPSAVAIRVCPPDRHGYASTGPSISYLPAAIESSHVVIAEVAGDVPWVLGDAIVPRSRITHLVESNLPGQRYRRVTPDPTSRSIAERVVALLPDTCALQVGIGTIPEAVLDVLAEGWRGHLRIVGMGVDGVVSLAEAGLLDPSDVLPRPAIACAELMGSDLLLDFAHANPMVEGVRTERGIAPGALSSMPGFVSVNSAVQIDLTGATNSEVIGGRQISGVGGGFDFFEGAAGSHGGLRILALPSTAREGSRIVPRLSGVPVTFPRHSVDVVITEYGAAWIRGATLAQRTERLIAIADPRHRDALANSVGSTLAAAPGHER